MRRRLPVSVLGFARTAAVLLLTGVGLAGAEAAARARDTAQAATQAATNPIQDSSPVPAGQHADKEVVPVSGGGVDPCAGKEPAGGPPPEFVKVLPEGEKGNASPGSAKKCREKSAH